MHTLLLTAALDDRAGAGQIGSRIGLQAEALTFDETTDIDQLITAEHDLASLACVLVDEASFYLQIRSGSWPRSWIG